MGSRFRHIALLLLPPILVGLVRRSLRPTPASQPSAAPPGGGEGGAADRRYWGLNDLDRKIEKYLNFPAGFYVELGANDGRLSSNTLFYEKHKNWKGILIEPAPNLYLQCRENRSPANHIVCAACVSFKYQGEFVKMIYSDSMSVSLDVESDIGDGLAHAELGRLFLKPHEDVFEFGAIAKTLNSILIDAQAPKLIDFLSLDVEGAELEVLRGVDHGAFKFRYMLIECRNIEKLAAYLAPLHYRLVEKFNEHDYMFELSSVGSAGAS